ncbi:hypothetical protein GC105_08820 [Alkalibaculum sp. M08DMB]|uniref:GerMN domain-containing protein n=1 Tax=Alkalibaculum sporogenes TaxID=2655001 RepID=A0A6A7K9A4_9FIRM|nr:GerMN domain-containing protein [Alkalibaculum sporogenes]MPW25891.1 hypothetical protein [Alkalibaculum sporogenes]
MKKSIIIVILIFVLILAIGCTNNIGTSPEDPNEVDTPSELPGDESPSEKELLAIEDYISFESDQNYIYVGEGNEYASYTVFTDYIDNNTNRIQTRINNGGTESIDVIEIKEGKLSVLLSKKESYYRDNLLNVVDSDDVDHEILLMEPLEKGTQWTLSENRIRYISQINVEIQTSLDNYKAIEVTTEGPHSVIKDYYAPRVGLVKTVFSSEGLEVTSTLSEIKIDAPFTKELDVFYPHEDGKIYKEHNSLNFYTNDISRIKIQELLRKEAPKESYINLISANTQINTLYLGQDDIAYIDLSKEFIDDMNLGASYESMVLQSITNTIGNYYGVQRVYLTVENNPYESGHILLRQGETISVNMD